MSMGEAAILKGKGLISVPSVSFPRGASDEPLHSLHSLQGLICDAGSTPINHVQKCLFLIFHTSRSEQINPLFV